MSQSVLASLAPAITVGNTQTFFYPIAGGIRSFTGEAHLQAPVGTPGTLSLMTAHFTLNPGATSTVNFRLNGANGSQALIPPGNGFTVDSSHTDTLHVGDLICVKYVTASTGTAVAPAAFNFTFTPSVAPGSQLFQSTALNDSTGTAISSNSTFFIDVGVGDGVNPQTVETRVGTRTLLGGSAHNFFIYLLTNTSAATVTCSLRKNGTTTLTNSVAIAGTTTGLFQDTSHTDTLAPNDSIYATKTGGTSGSTIAFVQLGFWLDYLTNAAFDLVAASVNSNGALYGSSSATGWTPVAGNLQNTVSNASAVVSQQMRVPIYATWSNLRIRILTNAITVNATMLSEITGVAGNQSVVITAGVTGSYEDTSHTDSLIPGNAIQANITNSGSSGNATFSEITSLLTNGAVPNKQVIHTKKRDEKKVGRKDRGRQATPLTRHVTPLPLLRKRGRKLKAKKRHPKRSVFPWHAVRFVPHKLTARRKRKDMARKRAGRRSRFPFQPVSSARRPFVFVQT